MSVITFTLKEEHVKLLKFLKWSLTDKKFIISAENINEDPSPFGGDNIYDDIDLILNGKPDNFNPLTEDNFRQYSKEQKDKMDMLMSDLPTALDIILYNGNFELGTYTTRYHDRQWKRKK